jgi:hypothetical protein
MAKGLRFSSLKERFNPIYVEPCAGMTKHAHELISFHELDGRGNTGNAIGRR